MHIDEFYQSRKADWERLTQLLDRNQAGAERLSQQDIQELGRLYRAATSDLALAQRDFATHRLTQYLNGLVARAHAVIYQAEPMATRRIWRFITAGYPRAFRRAWKFIALSAVLFFLPGLLAGLIVARQPEAAVILLPAGMHDMIPMIERQELWTNIEAGVRPMASSQIMTNNIQVSFLALAGGMLAGLLTVYVLVFNGLILGAITGLTAHYGVGFELWSFVIGHGVVELSVIVIAGGTGLMLGWAILNPGLLRRNDALALAGQQAARLIAGCVPLLVVAGTIEGFISPNENLPAFIKWGVGISSGVLLYGYLLLAGRSEESGGGAKTVERGAWSVEREERT